MNTQEFRKGLNARIARHDLLTHPFYQAWAKGELTREDLRCYAIQYFHHVAAFPDYLEMFESRPRLNGELVQAVAENRAGEDGHAELWLDFAEGMGADRASVSSEQPLAEIQDLIARTAFTQLGYSGLLLAGTLLGMLITYLLPVIFTFSAQPVVWRLGLAAWVMMAITYLPTVRFYRMSPLWAATLPVAAAFYTYATWVSAVRYWLGRGGQWKGRAQAPAKSSAQ